VTPDGPTGGAGETSSPAAATHDARSETADAFGRFAARLAHDYNNLLGVVLGNLRMLAERGTADAERTARRIDLALQAAQRATDLGDSIARLAGGAGWEPQRLNADAFVQSWIAARAGGAIELAFTPGAPHAVVSADPVFLSGVLENLVANAIAAGPADGAVRIATATRDDKLVIAVADRGCGMTAEVAARAFEPFYTTRIGDKQAGMGLPVALAIVRQAGGAISLSSAPGEGTTVEIVLPLVS
jgi:signal transduction histidine kinase